jgi:spore maturation protein CgeB
MKNMFETQRSLYLNSVKPVLESTNDFVKDDVACRVRQVQKKVLVICSTLNLDYPYGATPAIWQLLKGLFEVGCDVIAIPYRGNSIRTPWWRSYPNPTEKEGELYAGSGMHTKSPTGLKKSVNDKIVPKIANMIVTRKWKKLFSQIEKKEKEIDAVLLIGVPLNHFNGLAEYVKSEFSCPLIYYDLDVPTSLPKYGGFSFSYYLGADISKYDAIIVPSEGVSDELLQLGARRVFKVHFGVDPDLYLPVKAKQDIDVFFFATSDSDREDLVSMMISEPSKCIAGRFLVSGIKYKTNLGKAQMIPMLPFSVLRTYAGRSKINLNITRKRHALTYTSTSRPFELAAMNCCIVSSPYLGLEKWFTVNKEVFVASNQKEAMELYDWLLNDEELRKKTADSARARVLKDHTFQKRASGIVGIFDKLK